MFCAATTPLIDACINPLVIPAPSPIAYTPLYFVSKLLSTSIFA